MAPGYRIGEGGAGPRRRSLRERLLLYGSAGLGLTLGIGAVALLFLGGHGLRGVGIGLLCGFLVYMAVPISPFAWMRRRMRERRERDGEA
jgi:hypothetical protein